MRIDDLASMAHSDIVQIHTGKEYFHDLLAWLHDQGFTWNSGDSLADKDFPLNQRPSYGDSETIEILLRRKKIRHGERSLYINPVEYEDVFHEEPQDFSDLDSLL